MCQVVQHKMIPGRRFPPRPRKAQNEEGCVVEIKKTKSGKKIRIGKNCTREQIKMIQDSEVNFQGED